MSRETFDCCLDFVFEREGGYVDDPHDPGGATNMGITLATLAAWRGRRVGLLAEPAVGGDATEPDLQQADRGARPGVHAGVEGEEVEPGRELVATDRLPETLAVDRRRLRARQLPDLVLGDGGRAMPPASRG